MQWEMGQTADRPERTRKREKAKTRKGGQELLRIAGPWVSHHGDTETRRKHPEGTDDPARTHLPSRLPLCSLSVSPCLRGKTLVLSSSRFRSGVPTPPRVRGVGAFSRSPSPAGPPCSDARGWDRSKRLFPGRWRTGRQGALRGGRG